MRPHNDGAPVFSTRPLVQSDREMLERRFEALSLETRRLRFFTPQPRLRAQELDYLTNVDQTDHIALVVCILEEGGLVEIGVGRAVRLQGRPETAELSLLIVDEYQGRGAGRFLLTQLAQLSASAGVRYFQAAYLAENLAIEHLFRHFGATPAEITQGVCEVVLDLKRFACDEGR